MKGSLFFFVFSFYAEQVLTRHYMQLGTDRTHHAKDCHQKPRHWFQTKSDVQGIINARATSFWRVTVETLPYCSYTVENVTTIVYYSATPWSTIQIWKDSALHNNPFGSITLLDPNYEYNAPTGHASLFGIEFYTTYGNYVPVRTTQIFAGDGDYVVSLEMTVGCFNFTIEEYR